MDRTFATVDGIGLFVPVVFVVWGGGGVVRAAASQVGVMGRGWRTWAYILRFWKSIKGSKRLRKSLPISRGIVFCVDT